MRRPLTGLLLLLTALLSLALPATTASAHAVLVQSLPAHGQNLERAPSQVELQFNEPVTAAFTPIVVRDSQGRQVDLQDAMVDPRDRSRATVSLHPLADGLYTAVYRVTSLDGHPIEGTIAFTIGKASAAAVELPPPEAAAPSVPVGVSLVHGLAQWSAVLLAGLPVFLLFVWLPVASAPRPAGLRPLAAGLLLLLVGSGLVEMSLYAVRASGEPWSPGLLLQALTGTRVGTLWLLRTALGLLTAGAMVRTAAVDSPSLRAPLALPGTGLLLTFSLQSHAVATGFVLPILADWVHLLAGAPWVGGVAGFAFIALPRLSAMSTSDRGRVLAETVPRFSRLAIAAVLLMTVTGVYSALHHIPDWAALWNTAYGQSLLWKLLLLIPVFALGAYHLTRRGTGRFSLAIGAEIILLFGIFVAAGFLSSLPPAGVERALRQGPFAETARADGFAIDLTITPNRLGFNQAVIRLTGPDGRPVEGASTGLRATMVEHEMGLQTLEAQESSPGVYTVGDLVLGMFGQWRIEVVTLTRGGQEVRHPFRVTVPAPPR